jgi:deazaflavin-dependent oxidoreductase (nitroreductase family)
MRCYVGRIVTGIALSAVVIAAVRASGIHRDTAVRQFNKRVLNPFALRMIARRKTYYSVLHHVGRHSGKAYDTPVVAKSTSEGIVIPLPYGAETDWCRNVLASDGCTLSMNGTEYTLVDPRVIPPTEAEPLLPHVNARLWHTIGMKHYLLLHVQAQAIGTPRETRQPAAA